MNTYNLKKTLLITRLPYPNDVNLNNDAVTFDTIYSCGTEEPELPDLNCKSYKPKAKDKLFIHQGCNLPRYKIRDWAKKHDISITIKEEKATASFLTEATPMSFFKSVTMYRLEKSTIETFFRDNDYSEKTIETFLLEAEQCDNDYVYLHWQVMNNNIYERDYHGNIVQNALYGGIVKTVQDITNRSRYRDYCRNTHCYKEDLEKLNVLYSSNLYLQDELIEIINKDSIIINEEIYENIDTMLLSHSNADKIMALEILSNTNIIKSMWYLLLIFRKHGHTIFGLQESRHVAFKSLTDYLDISRYTNIDQDYMMEKLMDCNELTYDMVKVLADEVKNEMKQRSDRPNFKILKVTISDEVKKYFGMPVEEKVEEEIEEETYN